MSNSIPIVTIQKTKGGKMPNNEQFLKVSVHLGDPLGPDSAIMMHTDFCFIKHYKSSH